MMIDIFQYSNIYTLKPSISHLAADESIMIECGPYVTRPGHAALPWPDLLRLYSKLQAGTTVHQWLETNDALSLGIDARRFVSFGIIKGFLRRIHRWPITQDRTSPIFSEATRRHVEFDKSTHERDRGTSHRSGTSRISGSSLRGGDSTFTLRSTESAASLGISPADQMRPRPLTATSGASDERGTGKMGKMATSHHSGHSGRSGGGRLVESHGSGSRRTLRSAVVQKRRRVAEDLVGWLDGMHHADEIQVEFHMGWAELEKILGLDGGEAKKGVVVLYR